MQALVLFSPVNCMFINRVNLKQIKNVDLHFNLIIT